MTFLQRNNNEPIQILLCVKDQNRAIVDLSEMKSAHFGLFNNRQCSNCFVSKGYPGGGIITPSPLDGQLLIDINPEDILSLIGLFYWKATVTIKTKTMIVADGMIKLKKGPDA